MTETPRVHYTLLFGARKWILRCCFYCQQLLIHLPGWQGAFVTLSGLGLLSGDESDSVTYHEPSANSGIYCGLSIACL